MMANMKTKRMMASALSALLLMAASAPSVLAQDAATPSEAVTEIVSLVELITPPPKAEVKEEETKTPEPVIVEAPVVVTAPEKEKTVAAPGASISTSEDKVTVKITGESGLAIYADLSGDLRTDLRAGDTVAFSGLAAGKYELEVDYHDVQKGVSAYRTSVNVAGKPEVTQPAAQETTPPPTQETTPPPADDGKTDEDKTVAAPGATYSVSGDSVTVKVSGEPGLRMYVDATVGWDDEVYAGESVNFTGLEAGKTYGIEVDYYELQQGVSAYRTSFTVPAADETTPPPQQQETTPPATGETTPPAVEVVTPPPSAGEADQVKQFDLMVSEKDGEIIVQITGASSREVDIELLKDGNRIDLRAMIGNGVAAFAKQNPGKYTVRAFYVTPADGVSAVEKEIEIKSASAGTPEKQPTVKKIGASVKTGKDYIEIKVTDADPWPMYVAVGNAYKTISLGQTVRFEGLSVGKYDVEVDYTDPVSGVSPYRTTVSVEKEQTYKPLKYGDTGDEVEEMTERLRDLGYMDDDVRRYSSAVREAVKLFQKLNGLTADGIAGEETLKKLYSSSAVAYGASGSYLTLQRGDKGLAAIYQLQRRLKDLGYYTIAVDGDYGSGTERAVRHFQRINGLEKTGIADSQTQKLLYSSAAKPADSSNAEDYKLLSRSSKYHPAVVPLQRRLKALGYAVGAADGYFGSQTYRAVREFQRRNGLKATGIADETTQRMLFSSSAIAASGASSSSSSSSSGSYGRQLYWGCEGEDVRQLQKALLAKGYKQVRTADGVFGQWTYDAVRAFQKDHGLSVDGIAGKNTLRALYGY